MLDPSDVLAHRLLKARVPEKRAELEACLRELRAGQHRGLLRALEERGVLTQRQADYVRDAVRRYREEAGARSYAQLLVERGQPAERLQQIIDALPAPTLDTFGAALVSSGVLPPADEPGLRTQARQRLQDYLQAISRQAEGGAAAGDERPVELTPSPTSRLRTGPNPLRTSPIETTSRMRRQELLNLLSETPVEGYRTRPPHPAPPTPAPLAIPAWVDQRDPLCGQVVAGYAVRGRIGAGGMGTVYLVEGAGSSELMALKLLPADAAAESRGRFKREILANSFFSHPGALEVHDAGQTDDGRDYLVMEFFPGQNVMDLMEREGRLEPPLAVSIAKQVAGTLAAAHSAQVVHRDVKPDNILLSDDRRVAKLMDFGIATIGDLGELGDRIYQTMTRGITGTPEYVSPEQAGGDAVGPSSDLYSLGCSLYHMLSGRLPFESETSHGYIMLHIVEEPLPLVEAHPAMAKLPTRLVDLVMGLLAKTPEERPSAPEVQAGLRVAAITLS